MNRYCVNFEYADELSNWEWNKQCCIVYADTSSDAVRECMSIYGLGVDCNYHIVSVEEVTS